MKALLQRWLQRWAINIITKHLFHFVTVDEIVIKDAQGNLWVGGHKLEDAEAEALRRDALAFKDSIIWKALTNEVKYRTYVATVPRSTTAEDLVGPKAQLKALEIMEDKLIELSS